MTGQRDIQLDAVRAVAVTLVLYAHFLAPNGTSFLGHLGVRLFFVLSGFLITRLLLDARDSNAFVSGPALRAFYARRVIRIFPPYFAVLALVWLTNLEQSSSSLAWHALYLSNFWYALRNDWNPWLLCHFWSLSIEEQFYLAWPLIVLLAPRRRIEAITIGVILFSFAYRFYWPLTANPALARDLLPPASMDALGCGALLAVRRARSADVPRWMRLGWPAFAVVFLLVVWSDPGPANSAWEWGHWALVQVLPLVPLVAIVAACSNGLGGRLGKLAELPPLLFLGRISYGVYLYHPILLAYAVKAQPWIPLNVSEQGPGRFLVAGAATLLVASLSWALFEKPLNSLKRYFPYVARSRAGMAGETSWIGPPASVSALDLQQTEARR
ncbi:MULTISPECIES: acyltransferase [unclassified Mesorhizobium]|uniref:acyltransferase family protein n=1 Tax=unclassified Mesorhizobium TaxID=325217 RepID=UPI000FCB48A6|nr:MULTISPECIES: acyltransferase [unclassified Mesorhizobium]RUW00107.1 acyltransferase [Mesorhizobium sp. M1A.F.Ca.IN.020.04.1.1]RUW12053.1 acyltransferase [Mesorhizobium sp. M1A.F.Ca.IN.020.03.1.1]RWG12348.1 MAG: acyltransferase [Mesorhizobium sp.]RWG35343.1 MAG: acyltransferase [Mesorhizobium sp.]RWH15012.1 MAG: acyltransferase [Mesorhizobium sp.]